MEALACGTPVIAYPSGALTEIVEPGKTGFFVHNQREMAEAIQAAETISPERCRAEARRRFGLDRMIGKYLEVYHGLAESSAGTRRESGLTWNAVLTGGLSSTWNVSEASRNLKR
jgi:glycosyltransferase involved in cell wall biosynthesis